MTPGNIYDLESLFNRIFEENPSLDLATIDKLKKAQKGACKAIANAETQRVTNDRLLEVAKEQKRKGSRKKGTGCSVGRVMGIEIIEEREQKTREAAFLKAWKEDFSIIDPEVFTEPKARSRKRKGKAIEATEVMEATIPLLDPKLFDEPTGLSPMKEKGKRKAAEEKTKPRKKAKGLREQEIVEIEAQLWAESSEVRTRAGRVVKRTSKMQRRA